MKQNRLKSPVLWSAAAGIVLLTFKAFGFELESEAGSQLAGSVFELVCAVLAMFGIANNPTDKSKF